MTMLSILHLADFHFQSPPPLQQVRLLEGLLTDLEKLNTEINMVAIAGDLTFSGRSAEFDEAKKFLDNLLATLKLGKDRLFIVPGNHDANRNNDKYFLYVRQVIDSVDDIEELVSNTEIMRGLWERFYSYRSFIHNYFDATISDYSNYIVSTFQHDDINIAVIGLNSALLAGIKSGDKGNLVLGQAKMQEALDKTSNVEFRIVVNHFPFIWLKEFDRMPVESILKYNCHLILNGHPHDRIDTINMLQNEAIELFGGGSAVEGNFNYNVIKLDFSENQGTVINREYTSKSKKWGVRLLNTQRDQSGVVFPLSSLPPIKELPAPAKIKSQHRMPVHNLPNRPYSAFVGRDREIKNLRNLLFLGQTGVSCIAGMGGVGKSTLALELAYRLVNNYNLLSKEEQFDAIVWISARPSILTTRGILPCTTVYDNLEDIVNTIILTFDQSSLLRESKATREKLIYNLLRSKKTLIILDNIESFKDETVWSFLRDLPSSTKALVTSRHLTDVGSQLKLSALSRSEGLQLIKFRCAEKNVQVNEEESNKIANLAYGVPLVIEWITALLGFGYTLSSIEKQIINPNSDVLKFILNEAILSLSEPAKHILTILAYCEGPVGREFLALVAGYQDDEITRDGAIAELEKLSLVNVHDELFSILPMIKVYVQQELRPNEVLQKNISHYIYSGKAEANTE
jgi:predicted MPP superfamily phosphohydrolase